MRIPAQTVQPMALNTQPVGRPKVITDEYVNALQRLVKGHPRDYGYPFKWWTATSLRRHLAQEFEISVSDRHINRLLQHMGLSRKDTL